MFSLELSNIWPVHLFFLNPAQQFHSKRKHADFFFSTVFCCLGFWRRRNEIHRSARTSNIVSLLDHSLLIPLIPYPSATTSAPETRQQQQQHRALHSQKKNEKKRKFNSTTQQQITLNIDIQFWIYVFSFLLRWFCPFFFTILDSALTEHCCQPQFLHIGWNL